MPASTSKSKPLTEEQRLKRCEKKRLYYIANKHLWQQYFQQNKTLLTQKKKERRARNIFAYRDTDRLRELRNTQNKTGWRHRNPKKFIEMRRNYYASNPEVRKKVSMDGKKRRREHPEKIKQWFRNKMATDLNYRTRTILRKTVCLALRRQQAPKIVSSLNLFGCDVEFLRKHLESLFLPGMSWENYGVGEGKWNVDHIRPCASFNLTEIDQQRQCFNFKNLQPLWAIDNNRKQARMPIYA